MQVRRNRKNLEGFTLLELLLAISISVVISAGAYHILSASSEAILYLKDTQSKLKPIQELQWLLRYYLHSTIVSREYTDSANFTDAKKNTGSNSQTNAFEQVTTSYLRPRAHDAQYLSTITTSSKIKAWQDQITAIVENSFEDSYSIVAQTLEFSPKQGRPPYSLKMTLKNKKIGELTLHVSR